MLSLRLSAALLMAVCLAGAAISTQAHHEAWKERAVMSVGRSDLTITPVDSLIYAIGGCTSNQNVNGTCSQLTNVLARYDAEANEWSTLANVLTPRYRHSAAHVDGSIYVFGGRDSTDTIVTEVEVYNISADTWSTLDVAADTTDRSDAASFVLGNKIYLVGGYDDAYNALSDVLVLDTTDNNTLAKGFESGQADRLPVALGDLGCVAAGGKGYCFGGFTEYEENSTESCQAQKSFLEYDPTDDTWTPREPLKQGRGDMAYAVMGSTVIVAGGETKSAQCADLPFGGKSFPVDDVETFDVSKADATWVEVADIEVGHESVPKFRFAAAAVGLELYSFGGQGEIQGTTEENAEDPANTDGYYPVSNRVYSVDLEHHDDGAASAAQASGLLVALVALLAMVAQAL